MSLLEIRILDGGYCLQSKYFTGRASLRRREFHALFLYIEHPLHGSAVIDTGYSPLFYEATSHWPYRLYRMATPVPTDSMPCHGGFIEKYGIVPEKVKTVFLSHFHADHIGGLCNYPNAEIVCAADAYESLVGLSPWQQTRAGFLPGLLGDDVPDRMKRLDRSTFVQGAEQWQPFRIHDYWGDGSVVLVDLPGHAPGQLGFFLRGQEDIYFYTADAYWDIEMLRIGKKIPWIARQIQHDWPKYCQTQQELRDFDSVLQEPDPQNSSPRVHMLATHCPQSLRLVRHG